MRSKANFKTHPIHPMLIPFPIAFLVGAFVFDLLGVIFDSLSFAQTGFYLSIAGIVMALVAAIPGIIDYIYTVPPDSSAKTRATKHMVVNLSAVALFFIAILFRNGTENPSILTLIIQGIGLAFLTAGGWMGGTMVFRNQIGVDHRYAKAGKWDEVTVNPNEKEPVVGNDSLLALNQMMLVHLDGKRIVVAKTEKGYTAFDDRCTHKGGSLADGTLACGTVQCPWHGSHFNVHTGEATEGPATKPVKTYPVEIREGKIVLKV
jgi:nitrite reductase/ring-hydroxylating ferredoxin subunit/uncharacterized membrane protein